MKRKRRYQSDDGWGRGSFDIPALAVVGSSDTGMWSDSPAPSNEVTKELNQVKQMLAREGLHPMDLNPTQSGNVFMGKRWVGVPETEWDTGMKKVKKFLKKKKDLSYIHDALGRRRRR